mmetsp:Transcript_2442/g.9482  ORF Transcript_2442/g.9482 Transcript_2442/m.9482 type:complete len:223 (+) Transcript_2442:1622-2290(+)
MRQEMERHRGHRRDVVKLCEGRPAVENLGRENPVVLLDPVRGLGTEQFDLHLAVLVRTVPQSLRHDRPRSLHLVADRAGRPRLKMRVVGYHPQVTLRIALVPASLALLLEEQPRFRVGLCGGLVAVVVAALLLLPTKLAERLELEPAVRVVDAGIAPLELKRDLLRLFELRVRARPGGCSTLELPPVPQDSVHLFADKREAGVQIVPQSSAKVRLVRLRGGK